jgi:hypothetical protein
MTVNGSATDSALLDAMVEGALDGLLEMLDVTQDDLIGRPATTVLARTAASESGAGRP